MKTASHDLGRASLLALLTLGLLAAPALAQSPEDAILEGDTGGVGLIEKKPTAKKVLDDPDPKGLEALNKRREALEAFINEYQENFTKERVLEVKVAKKLKKVSDSFDKLTADALAAGDKFATTHNPQLAEYRAALAEDRGPDVKKAAGAIAKTRKAYDKTLGKLEKRVEKVKKAFEKLAPQLEPPPEEDGE